MYHLCSIFAWCDLSEDYVSSLKIDCVKGKWVLSFVFIYVKRGAQRPQRRGDVLLHTVGRDAELLGYLEIGVMLEVALMEHIAGALRQLADGLLDADDALLAVVPFVVGLGLQPMQDGVGQRIG